MIIMRFLLCLILVSFSMPNACWIPEDNPSSSPLTEEQMNAVMVRWEECDAQDPVNRKKLFERYRQTLFQKNEITFFSLLPPAILDIALEYQFPLQLKTSTTKNKTYSHRSYGVPGVCCCESCT